jgi:hypothetical protein
MARAFTWRDLLILLRYRDRAIFLDNTLSLTYAPGLLSTVLLSLIFPGSGFFTMLQSPEENALPVVGQMYRANVKPMAKLTFLAPKDEVSPAHMVRLLSYICQQAGERGAFHILAEVQQEGLIADCMRQSGFRPYAEQRIWSVPEGVDLEVHQPGWRPLSNADGEEIHRLYGEIIPRDVQRVEAPPRVGDLQGLACRVKGELVGYSSFHWGPKGVLVDLVIDPAQPALGGHIKAICEKLPPHRRRNIYFRVRTYQEKLASALEEMGAQQGPDQLAMVKYLAVHYRAKQAYNVGAFEKQPDITTPFVKTEDNKRTYVK